MLDADKKEFFTIFQQTANFFKGDQTPENAKLYFYALGNYSFKDVKRGFELSIGEMKSMPKPAHIKEFLKEVQAKRNAIERERSNQRKLKELNSLPKTTKDVIEKAKSEAEKGKDKPVLELIHKHGRLLLSHGINNDYRTWQ